MKKIIIKANELEQFFSYNAFNGINQQSDCPAKGCDGKVSFTLNQAISGSVALCSKCKKGIIFKETHC